MTKHKIFSLTLAVFVLSLAVFPGVGQAVGSLSLGQTSVNLQAGQNTTITVYVPYGETANVLGNTNVNVATAYVSGNSLFINALSSGSTTIRVCTNSNDCGSVFVTVSGSGGGNYGQISLSPSSVSLSVNESRVVTVYNNSGQSIYVSNNSNSNVASVTLSFNSLTVHGQNSGSTTISICSSGSGFGSQCASLYVTVSGSGGGNLTFSDSNPFLNVGQSRTISVLNNTGNNLYISNNSNSNVVSTSLSFNSINLYGQNSGSSTIRVCENNSGRCGYLYVTVGSGGGSNQVMISQDNVFLNINQSANLNVIGGYSSYMISYNSNSYVADANISGNTLWIFGRQSGNTTIRVCSQNNSSLCDTVFITVGSGGSTNQVMFESNNVNMTVGATKTIRVLNSSTSTQSLFVSNNSNSSAVDVSTGADYVNLSAKQNGSSDIIICRGGTSYCGILSVTVGSGSIAGNLIYQNGTLVNDNGTIYITYKNSKSGFASMSAFTSLGYKLSNVIVGSTSSLSNTGYVIGNPNIAHPWGSWIKSGQTIYFVHQTGLIPFADYNVFLNNGGQSRLVVESNFRDFANKSILFVMSLNDTRLK